MPAPARPGPPLPLDPELEELVGDLRFDFAPGLESARRERGGGPDAARPLESMAPLAPADVVLEVLHVPGAEGSPPVRVLVASPAARPPEASGRPAILHIHGGGFVTGSADRTIGVMVDYVRGTGAVVASVDYRLAPEAPHPGPLEDCHAALRWLVDTAGDRNIDTSRLAVSGQSAGGGLAAALCLRLRNQGGPRAAFQHLVYPMLDDRTGSTADPPAAYGRWVWTRSDNRLGWSALLGADAGRTTADHEAVPARATTLAGLPPTFIACGSLDLFLPEDLEFARRMMDDGVAVEVHVYPGATHGFTTVQGSRVARRLLDDSIAAFRAAFAVPELPAS